MKQRIRRTRFTLVELLAAMAVFSVLLLVSMQIFSGAQNIWLGAEKKSDAFTAAREVMEFITSRLDTVHYSQDILFAIDKRGTDRHRIYFATMMPMSRKKANGDDLDKNSLRFLTFQVDDKGVLKMAVLSDKEDSNYEYLLPPFDQENITFSSLGGLTVKTERSQIFAAIKNNLTAKADASDPETSYPQDVVVLAENVVALRFNAYHVVSTNARSRRTRKDALQNLVRDTSTTDITELPYLIEIELTVFDTQEHYEAWSEASGDKKKELLTQYSYTFNRSLFFGDRM